MGRFVSFCLLLALFSFFSHAQENSISSRNGQVLPVKGTIRILLVFVEVEYPAGVEKNATDTNEFWKPGAYPVWASDLFDVFPSSDPKGLVSRYYHECSFGQYNVVADILLNPDNPEIPFQYKSKGDINVASILNEAWNKGFRTKTALPADSFDLWLKSAPGKQKLIRTPDSPLSFDHVMVIVRNCTYPGHLAGYASSGNVSRNVLFKTDSYSVFSSRSISPFNILLHEYNHLLFGGNNLHCCGGNHSSSGPQLFLSFQGGWGMMGAANKSLLSCNAWDRYKLGWKRPEKEFYISALNFSAKEINTDFDFRNEYIIDTLIVLRDFITSGDALRIRLPGVPDDEYQQWLWIENHQTKSFNGSLFDVFQYEESGCTDHAVPGIYAYLQVSHDDLYGKNVFGGYADFIRPLPASGMYDFAWGDTLVRNDWCLNNGLYYPFERKPALMNPLSGNAVTEIVAFDNNFDGHLEEKEKRDPAIERVSGGYVNNLPYLGESEMAFVFHGNNKIAVGTNPSSANALTLLNDNRSINKGMPPDNRVIYLNSVSVEILRENWPSPGDVLLRVRNGDNVVSQNVRWSAPKIVLPDLPSDNQFDLIIDKRRRVIIDAGLTPTRIDSVIIVKGKTVITDYTHFQMMPGTRLLLRKGARLDIRNKSVFHVSPDAVIVLEKGARIIVGRDSKLINEGKIIKR